MSRERAESERDAATDKAELELSRLRPSTRRSLESLVVSVVECGDLSIAAMLVWRWYEEKAAGA